MGFNKEKFASLLQQAKGKRSINKYGSDSDVDPGYISRLLRCLVDTAPSAIVIKKLAEKAHNNIMNEELMAAAGYLDEEFVESNIENDNGKNIAFFGGRKEELSDEEAAHLEESLELFRLLKAKRMAEKNKDNN